MYDPLDQRGVPVSRGVPMLVRIATIVGILCIFGIGGATIIMAGFGHHWAWQQALRVPLSKPR